MNKNLLIIGAGAHGLVAKEIAESMGCFEKISFVDDDYEMTPNGIAVVGKVCDVENLVSEYYNVIVALTNPEHRLQLINKLEEETPCRIVTLISPHSYISPSAQIGKGSIVEPKAVIGTGSVVLTGCIISAGAVIGYYSMCCDATHIDCNATVAENTLVPAGTKVGCGVVYKRNEIMPQDLFFDSKRWQDHLMTITVKVPDGGPVAVNGKEYSFEDGM